jgi:cytoskeletal protein CcmA (bactofilin family)
MFLRGKQQARNGGGTGTALVVTQPARPRPSLRSTAPSIIAADLHIVGNVSTEGELHIDGRIDGDVQRRSVTVGDSGHVVGHVETNEIVIQGIVSGSVRAQKVHLATGCKVIADISHGSLMIDEGASFEGQCRRVTDDERAGGLDLGKPLA